MTRSIARVTTLAGHCSTIVSALALIGVAACSGAEPPDEPLRANSALQSFEDVRPHLLPPGSRTTSPLALEPLAEVGPAWFKSLLSASDQVVRGQIRRMQSHSQGPHAEPGIFTRIELEIDDAVPAESGRDLDFWVEGGVLENRARLLSLGARFRVGETVVVFLREHDGQRRLVHMGLGKWSASLNPERFAPAGEARRVVPSSDGAPPALSWDQIARAATAGKARP